MPNVNLRTPFWDKNGKLYRPGKDVEVPQSVADALGTARTADAGPGLTGGGGKEGGDAAWPDGFPSADLLQDAGVKSATDAQGMSREELVALPGIGPARADQILGWRAQG
jgi:hypothetical protein